MACATIRLIPTKQYVQCRNEQPFEAVITVYQQSGNSAVAINCPHCGRGYIFDNNTGEWSSDRSLVFLDESEVAEAVRNATG